MVERVVVVGAGLGGLAAACTLAARGRRVLLLEANETLGGKAARVEGGGFRFDLGPTILTVPSVLRRIFAEAGRRLEKAVQLVRLDPQWRAFYADGSTLDLVEDVDSMAERLRPLGDAEGYRRFQESARAFAGIAKRNAFWRPVGSLRDAFTWARFPLGDVVRSRPHATVAGTVRAHVKDPRVAQLLDHFTQYVGSAPALSPAVLCSIAHLQTDEGVHYPVGGTRAVALALERLATDLGVEVRTGARVERVLVEGGRVAGVATARETIRASAVVSNADAVRTLRELVGGDTARRFDRRRRYEPACSGVVLYLGLDRAYPRLAHHNFVFSRDPEEEFEAIYRRGEPAPDPTCYVCAPARTEPGVAPPGGEALYVLVHVPYLRPGHDWKRLLPTYRRTIVDKLSQAGMGDLESRVRFEEALTPEDLERRFRVLSGAIYGVASHGRLQGAFKPCNRSPDVPGLYLAGGAAHPGPGMPMVLMSGWIAADALDRDRRAVGA